MELAAAHRRSFFFLFFLFFTYVFPLVVSCHHDILINVCYDYLNGPKLESALFLDVQSVVIKSYGSLGFRFLRLRNLTLNTPSICR